MLRKPPTLGAALVAVVSAATVALAAAAGPPPGHGQKIVFGSNRADGQRDLYTVYEDGTGLRRLTFDGEDYRERVATWSPDGSRIAYAASHDGNFDIYTIDANGGDRRRITTDPARDDYPSWTSDGRIVFTRGLLSDDTSIWIVGADGTNPQRLNLPGPHAAAADASPRGSKIVYATDASGLGVIHVATLDGTTVSSDVAVSKPAHDGLGDQEPKWSPSGNDIVYLHDHGNVDNDIYVVHADGSGQRQLTNTPNRPEFWVNWSSDGKEVLFMDGSTGKLRAIAVDTLAERAVGTTPRAPFADDFSGPQDSSLWGLFSDPGPGQTATQANGQVTFTIAGDAQVGGQYNQVASTAYTKCDLKGDYDMQVDYSLLQWPHLGGYRATLNAFWGNTALSRASVSYPGAPDWNADTVQGWAEDANGSFASTDTTGTLRIVKKNGLATGYVRDGDAWRPVYSGHSRTDGNVGFGLGAQAQEFAHLDGAVAFDNFKVTSGTFSCPDWWQDVFPDVFVG
jgi:Tol biopolymer transport system component